MTTLSFILDDSQFLIVLFCTLSSESVNGCISMFSGNLTNLGICMKKHTVVEYHIGDN